MPEYKPRYVDPNDIKKMSVNDGKPFSKSDYEMEKYEWDRLFRINNVYTMEEFYAWREKLAQQFRDSQSNWFQRLAGLAWFDLILPLTKKHLTPKRLMYYLTKIDLFMPYMPNKTFEKILGFLDNVAEAVYKKME